MRSTFTRPFVGAAVLAVLATSCGSEPTVVSDDTPDSTGQETTVPESVRQPGAVEPVGRFSPDTNTDQTTVFFETGSEAIEFLDGITPGESGDGEPVPDVVRARLVSSTADEVVLVVIQNICSPSHFELIETETGYRHTKWEEPVDCEFAPPEALVYAIPRINTAGVEFDPADPPEVVVGVIDEES